MSDITYIRAKDNWVYFIKMMDLANREIVGRPLSEDMTVKNTVIKAWYEARGRHSIQEGFLLHSG